MTDDTIDTQFPNEVRAKLREIDAELALIKGRDAEARAEIEQLAAEHRRYLDIRAAIWSTAEIFVRAAAQPPTESEFVRMPYSEEFVPAAEAEARKRRDIRAEVLEFIARCGLGLLPTAKAIADGIEAPLASVERALARHERDGRLVEKDGVWSQTPPPSPYRPGDPPQGPAAPIMAIGDGIPAPWDVGEPPLPTTPIPSADHVLDFITRAGDMGVNWEQLHTVGATQSIMNILSHNETAALSEDGRWRAIIEPEDAA